MRTESPLAENKAPDNLAKLWAWNAVPLPGLGWQSGRDGRSFSILHWLDYIIKKPGAFQHRGGCTKNKDLAHRQKQRKYRANLPNNCVVGRSWKTAPADVSLGLGVTRVRRRVGEHVLR